MKRICWTCFKIETLKLHRAWTFVEKRLIDVAKLVFWAVDFFTFVNLRFKSENESADANEKLFASTLKVVVAVSFTWPNLRLLTFKIAPSAGNKLKVKKRYNMLKPRKTQKSWEKKEKISNCGIIFIFIFLFYLRKVSINLRFRTKLNYLGRNFKDTINNGKIWNIFRL